MKEYTVLSFEYKVRRIVEDCQARCYRQVKEFVVEIPAELAKYYVIAIEPSDGGFRDEGLHYWRDGGSYAILLEKDGEKFVGVIDTEAGWTSNSNAIECPARHGTRLVHVCPTGTGWVKIKLKIMPLEEAIEYYKIDTDVIMGWFEGNELDEPELLTEYLLTIINVEMENYMNNYEDEETRIPIIPDP